jgi:hypothetical protein
MSSTIFNNKSNIEKGAPTSVLSKLDYGQLTQSDEKIFNTYKYWEPFCVPMQPVFNGKKEGNGMGKDNVTAYATKSLFNNFNAIFTNPAYREDVNMPLLDNPVAREKQRKIGKCSIKDLVEASAKGDMGRAVYNYSDFAYCKFLGKMPNNYLITLRRFPSPCGDKIDVRNYMGTVDKSMQGHAPDIGRLVTWMGTPGNDLENILKYSYGMQWEDKTAEIEDVDMKGEENKSPLAGLFNLGSSNYASNVQKGTQGGNFFGKKYMDKMLGGNNANTPPYSKADWERMYDTTKVYGPVDVIDTTKKRKRGLKFEQKFSLIFDYELRSYYGVNGKAAMIDLLGNILATTYTHGSFWGGERRFIGSSQDNIYANLPLFKYGDSGEFSFGGAWKAFTDSLSQGVQFFQDQGGLSNILKNGAQMLFGGLLNTLGRPQRQTMASLLSPAPVGCWHLTIGNPRSPIIEVGNLVCTNAEIMHYGPLGLDDFPTGISVRVELEHGKPRDIMGIEQMYNRGDTRVYTPMGEKVMDMYKNASKIKTSKTSKNNLSGNTNNKLKTDNSTQDNAVLPVEGNNAKGAGNIEDTNNNTGDIKNLKRYFGMDSATVISKSGAEALYGGEKHKNDHVKSGSGGNKTL